MFDWFWSALAAAFAWMISLLPSSLSDSFNDLAGYISGFGSSAKYIIYLMGIDVIVPLAFSIYTIRFVIRRIPFLN